jgi:hypothetical protein
MRLRFLLIPVFPQMLLTWNCHSVAEKAGKYNKKSRNVILTFRLKGLPKNSLCGFFLFTAAQKQNRRRDGNGGIGADKDAKQHDEVKSAEA